MEIVTMGDKKCEVVVRTEHGDEKNLELMFKNVKGIDDCTFNTLAEFSDDICAPFETTVRTYQDISLARSIDRISKLVNNTSVARVTYSNIANSDLTILFFEPFYPYSFEEWANSLSKTEEIMRDEKILRTFRSISKGVDMLHLFRHSDIGLENSIRIDDSGNAQIVLDKKGTDDLEKGVLKDIRAFTSLVDRVFSQTNSEGYRLFSLLDSHFTGRHDVHRLSKGSLRSYSYFIFHNALFYKEIDGYQFMYKLKMFDNMDNVGFRNKMFSNAEAVKCFDNWAKKIPTSGFLNDVYTHHKNYKDKYSKIESIMKFYYNCYGHSESFTRGITEIQYELDQVFPDAIYCLFYNFVEKIEAGKDFHSIQKSESIAGFQIVAKRYYVLDYFKTIHPSPDFTV